MTQRWLVLFTAFITAGAISASVQNPTFSVKIEEVRIDALVTEHGKPLRGLNAADFEVLDNGVPQVIEFAGFQQMPVSAILVLDMSGSIAGELLENLKRAVSMLLDGLKKDDRAALVKFSHIVSLDAPLTADLARVRMALDQAQPFGDTSLIDACYAGLILAESKGDRPLLIVFSDGLDTTSWLASEEVLEVAKRSDAVVYAVSAGQLPNRAFLRDLCKFTGGSLFEVESAKNLGAVFQGILEEFRQRYLLTYSPRNVSRSGWHALKVRVRGRSAKIMARPGYLPGSTGGDGE